MSQARRRVRVAISLLVLPCLLGQPYGPAWARSQGSGTGGFSTSTGLPADVALAAELLSAEDRRELSPGLLAMPASADPLLRARAALAVGRIGLPVGLDPLLALLDDPVADVRAMAAFGIGLLEYDLQPEAEVARRSTATAALRARLADGDAAVVAAAARALGFVGGSASPLDELLRAPSPVPVQLAALSSWWRLEGGDLGAVRPLADSSSSTVRLYVAHALRRADDPNATPALVRLLDDSDAEVQLMALRGLEAAPATLALQHALPLVAMRDARVQCAALAWLRTAWRDVSVPVQDDEFTAVLRRSLERTLHVRRCALETLGVLGERRPVAVDRLLTALGESEMAVRVTALEALGSVAESGSIRERVADRYAAALQPDGLSSLEPAEAAALVRWVSSESAEAALRLAGSAPIESRTVALRQLEQSAPDAARELALQWLAGDEVRLQQAAAGSLERLGGVEGEALDRVWRLYYDSRGTAAAGLRAAALPALFELDVEMMQRRASLLLQEPDRVLRLRALRALHGAGGRLAAPPVLEGRDTRRDAGGYQALAARVLQLQAAPPRLLLETSRGSISIQLQPELAALTSLQLLELAESGRLDDSPLHRVIAGFVTQGGGLLGEPAARLPNEESPVRYVAGTVGLALAGRDTGTSQFFITHAAQPHLEGAYPVFGQVIEGLRVALRVQPGDRIRVQVLR